MSALKIDLSFFPVSCFKTAARVHEVILSWFRKKVLTVRKVSLLPRFNENSSPRFNSYLGCESKLLEKEGRWLNLLKLITGIFCLFCQIVKARSSGKSIEADLLKFAKSQADKIKLRSGECLTYKDQVTDFPKQNLGLASRVSPHQ